MKTKSLMMGVGLLAAAFAASPARALDQRTAAAPDATAAMETADQAPLGPRASTDPAVLAETQAAFGGRGLDRLWQRYTTHPRLYSQMSFPEYVGRGYRTRLIAGTALLVIGAGLVGLGTYCWIESDGDGVGEAYSMVIALPGVALATPGGVMMGTALRKKKRLDPLIDRERERSRLTSARPTVTFDLGGRPVGGGLAVRF